MPPAQSAVHVHLQSVRGISTLVQNKEAAGMAVLCLHTSFSQTFVKWSNETRCSEGKAHLTE